MIVKQQEKNYLIDRNLKDRRQNSISYKRRNYDRRSKTFKYHRTIHLADTNMFGSVYFARFFDFQGEAREEFLQYFMGDDLSKFIHHRYGIVTVDAKCKYKKPLYLYDNIQVNLQVPKIKRAKFKICFETINVDNQQTTALGEQWIGVTDSNGKPIAIPEIVRNNLEKHLHT